MSQTNNERLIMIIDAVHQYDQKAFIEDKIIPLHALLISNIQIQQSVITNAILSTGLMVYYHH